MDECIDPLVEAVIFSTFDGCSGYWQLPTLGKDRYKTAFVYHPGSYQ